MDGVVFVINSFGIVEVEDRFGFDFLAMDVCCRPCSLGYKPYCFSEGTVFFSHNKSANSTFSHGFFSEANGPMAMSKSSEERFLFCK